MIITGDELLKKEINDVYKYAYKVIDRGIIGTKNSFKLMKVLEIHQGLKILLEELEYTLSKDIPIELVIKKTLSIKKLFIAIKNC